MKGGNVENEGKGRKKENGQLCYIMSIHLVFLTGNRIAYSGFCMPIVSVGPVFSLIRWLSMV